MKHLDQRTVLFWQVENAVGTVALLVVAVIGTRVSLVPAEWDRWIFVVVIIGLAYALLEALVLIPRRYRYYRYALTSDTIIVEQGCLWRRREVYPLARVLYCETRQGPILRLFNLFTVKAATIVDSRSIGPLSRYEADRFEHRIREHSS